MRSPEAIIAVPINGTYSSEGLRITVEQKAPEVPAPLSITPSDTAWHEAEHAVVARIGGTGVEVVTIVPGPGYNGMTIFDRVDVVAAAAPHAHGRKGTSHDMRIVESQGIAQSSAMLAARTRLRGAEEEVFEVAQTLQLHKTITGGAVDRAMVRAQQRKEAREQQEVSVFIYYPYGTTKTVEQPKITGESVLIFARNNTEEKAA